MGQISLSESQKKVLRGLSFNEPRCVCDGVSSHTADSLRVRGFIIIVEDNKVNKLKKFIKTERVYNVEDIDSKN